MTSFRAKLAVLCAAALSLSLSAFAQSYYPKPAKTSVICAGCPGRNHHGQNNAGLPTAPLSGPFVRHAGRYMDSTQCGDVQNLGMRTVRAMDLTIAASRNRIYTRLGSTFVAYTLDKFITTVGKPLVPISDYRGSGQFVRTGSNKIEGVAAIDQYVYAEASNNGWSAQGGGDGGERLFGYDYDDRGNVYLAYGPFYWGIYRDARRTDGSHMDHVSHFNQNTRTSSLLGAYKIMSLRAFEKYYMIVADSGQIEIYDVSAPGNPGPGILIRDLKRAFRRFAKDATGENVAIIDNGNNVSIFSAEGFVGVTAPIVRFEAPAGYAYNDVVFDGTRYWAALANITNGSAGNALVPITPTGGTYTLGEPVPLGDFQPSFANYGNGYLGLVGLERSSPGSDLYTGNGRLFRIDGSELHEIDLNNFFKNYYTYAPLDHARPTETDFPPQGLQPYKEGNRLYVIWADFGLGDVFEIEDVTDGTLRITPATGRAAGGDLVSISGSGLDPSAVRVFFGEAEGVVDTAASTPTIIRVYTPSHLAAKVDVLITSGAQSIRVPDGYTFTGCVYDLLPVAGVHASSAGSGSVQIVTTSGCTWSVTGPNNSFVSIGSPSGTGSGSATYSLEANTATTSRTVTITVAGKPFVITQNASGLPSMALTAEASPSQVALLWSAAPGAASYAIQRSDHGGPFAVVTTTEGLAYTDTAIVTRSGYLYQIVALDGSGQPLTYSNIDLAVPFAFTDPTITLGTPIRAIHFSEVRTAITAARNALRFAVRPFTSVLAPGALIQRSNLTELRTAINAIRQSVALPPLSYTDASVVAGTTKVRSAHIMETRRGLQ